MGQFCISFPVLQKFHEFFSFLCNTLTKVNTSPVGGLFPEGNFRQNAKCKTDHFSVFNLDCKLDRVPSPFLDTVLYLVNCLFLSWSCLFQSWSCLFLSWSCLFLSWSCLFMSWSCLFLSWSCLFLSCSCLFLSWSCLFLSWSCPFLSWSCLFVNWSCLFLSWSCLSCLDPVYSCLFPVYSCLGYLSALHLLTLTFEQLTVLDISNSDVHFLH
jgi:hypothetical protein